eukprot:TRINITY_DN104_c0_g1_i3.p1 TRINITY_DN104_c0_g1~~TRINITY_DN104_c0_g1_i3.p1  ORF type:complete len:300 (-),score=149.37 TRINITY_DN104_c0_g1_i3:1448-2347(-)
MEDSLLGDHACYSLVRVPDDGAHTLGSLAESKGITCSRGQGFYQLGKKKESVSEKKEMVLVERQDEDDEDAAAVVDAIDDAAKVRKELGIGAAKANINESVSEDFMVFVQSTSANRKLVPGAYALYRRDDIDVGKKRKLVLSGAESSAPKRAKKSAEPEVQSDEEEEEEAMEEEDGTAAQLPAMEDSLLGDHACYSLVRVPDDGAHTLGSLAESKGITCSRGQGFYQLGKKKESVSEKKEMVLVERQDEDDEDAAAVVDAIDDAAKVRKELGIGAAKANINESVSEECVLPHCIIHAVP